MSRSIEKGWIALDIDGTITRDKYSVPSRVSRFLFELTKEGWNIAIATGRPFAFASRALSSFDFPYIFLGQNGSLALEMPEKKVLFKTYIDPRSLRACEKAYEGVDADFLVYSGYEKGDFCYWRPDRFTEIDLRYLSELQKRQQEKWEARTNFDHLAPFPLIKCFGSKEKMSSVGARLKEGSLFEVSQIQDPFEERYHLLLVTDRNASKGLSLEKVFKLRGRGERVIAAGDDENDLSLLQAADIKIAMAHAPLSLQRIATFLAPPTEEEGIIEALQRAIQNED